jgi:hypothetical protein
MVGGIYVDDSGKIYVSDKWLNKIQVYDASGTFLSAESFGSAGSGTEQFNEASYGRFNPFTGDIVVVDTANHRLQIFENGVKIKNLINSADVINTSNSISLVTKSINPAAPNVNNLSAHLYFGDYLVSDFNVDLSSDRDWALVNAISLPDQSKSLIVNLNPTDAPGVSSTHSLYVTKRQGQTYVVVCPLATSIADLTLACVDGYTLNQGDAGLTVVTVDGQEYWKIEGLTGTGGLSPVINAYDLTPSATSVSVGTPINVEVVATDNVGLVDTDYVGTVHFSSSPATSSLPNDYTFVTGDAGSRTFGSISFNNPGTYILSATDTVDSARTQSIEITVTANSSNDNNGGNSNSSSSSSSGSSSNSGSCGSDVPSSVPDLFQINVSDTTATLYFTPIANANTFNFSYATTPNAEQYGATATLAREGVQHFTISLLKPNTTYYFKVGGQNGCRSGEYSNIMRIVTQRKGVTRQAIYYKNKSKVGQITSNKFAVIAKPKSIINEVVTNKIEPVSTPEVKVQKPTVPEKKCYLWGLWCR